MFQALGHRIGHCVKRRLIKLVFHGAVIIIAAIVAVGCVNVSHILAL